MSQPATTSTDEAFHPDALATIAALAAGRGAGDDQPAWHERALCAQTDPEAFFPENGASTRDAKQICSRCPVRAECLEHALRHDERFGVWGATSETERRVMRRARPATPPPPTAPAVVAVPEQRTHRARGRRESVPPPGRRAGSGVAGTLPTEPRGYRDQPTRPTSTFPARARRAPETSSPVSARATGRPTTRGSARETRPRPAAGATRAKHRTPLSTSTERTSDATSTETAVETDTGATPNDEVAAAAPEGPPDPSPPPSEGGRGQQPRRELHDVASLVLTGQHTACGSDNDRGAGGDLDGVDLDRVLTLVSTMIDGSPVAPAPMTGPGLWERRIAAVTAVLSGTLTRGRVARASGERAQDVAHWCRRHLEGMALVDTAAYPDGGDAAAGGHTAKRLVGER